MEDKLTYRQLHEEYMMNLNGTTNLETFVAVTPNFFTVFLICILALRTENNVSNKIFHNFCIEFFVIVGTAILSCTLLAEYLPHLVIMLFILCCSTYMYQIQPLQLRGSYNEFLKFTIPIKHKCYITNFRALINMLTCVSILAVDFTVFPRSFAKTETFGYSPMDAGVGLFCICNSIIVPSSISQRNIDKESSFSHTLMKTVKNCTPLIILGGVRFFTTTKMDYQVHISEYGVHWNFFLTLAVSKLISFFITRILGTKCSLVTSLIIVSIHEVILWKGLQEWVLSDLPRDNFLTANREGIVSALGYVALFTAGVGIGNLINNRSQTVGDLIVLIKIFSLFSIFLWTTTFASQDCLIASRRLANFGYYIWIVTFSVTSLTLYMIVDLFLQILRFFVTLNAGENVVGSEGHVPVLFTAINYNGLTFFLIANVLTGLINISVQTLRVKETLSIIILFIYTFCTCIIIYFLYCKNIKLKAW